jgi:glycosyltransferase involved in cell wall biosynthesis
MNPELKPLVSVGIPCYNRPEGLRRTLECITNQSYGNLEIIVSDNFSENPRVEEVGREFENNDSRIVYYRQGENIGAYNNFSFVLDKAKGRYFMWASDDDLWDLNFVSSCLTMLINNSSAGFAFSEIVNIDSYDRVIRKYDSFRRFTGGNKVLSLLSFILEPEIKGKANLIYSLIRTDLCRDVCRSVNMNDKYWGCDNSFVLGLLTRTDFLVSEDILLKKRMMNIDYNLFDSDSMIKIKHPNMHTVSLSDFPKYMYNNILATKGTGYWPLVIFCIPVKFIVSVYGLMVRAVLYGKRTISGFH